MIKCSDWVHINNSCVVHIHSLRGCMLWHSHRGLGFIGSGVPCRSALAQGAMANSDSSVSGLRPLRVPMTQEIHHSPQPFNPITLYAWPT